MREILLIARKEYVRHVRRRAFILTALVVPLLLLFGIGIAIVALQSSREAALGFVDQTGRFATLDLARTNDGKPPTIPMQRFADEAAGRAALTAGQVDALVIVPAQYIAQGQVRVVAPRGLSSIGQKQIEDVLQAGLVSGAASEIQARIATPLNLAIRTLGSPRTLTRNTAFLLFLLPYLLGIIFLTTTFTTSGYLLQALSDEKEDRIMEILATTLQPSQMMAGKIIGLSGVGLTQTLAWGAWIVSGILLFPDARNFVAGLALPVSTLALAGVFFLLGYLLVSAFYAAVGAAVTNPQEAQQFAGPLSVLVSAPFLLILAILAQPNSVLAVVLSLIPFTAPVTMLMRLPLATIPAWQIVTSLILLLASVVGVMLLAARVMRLGMLRYGKRLSLREIFGNG